ncbi:conserved hypothetical protein [Planktothrix serta PCC 8927]|uniref:Uncharacterized protein n=1 Tax=Planktothrix serta PCC 8927 TaxID=671068 RepID=A0A7Z9DUJ0_9CYAN|nr:hypothetical protein [Planktothrix serta]VXD10590.1 conserved hypothetical protein [Planktothrix serta PCC 8927]
MSTNQTQSTQRTTPDPLKSTREKLARKIKTALKTTSPEETLQIWMLIKQQELKRTTPGLSQQQIESVLQSLILELGYDVIAMPTLPLAASLTSEIPIDTTNSNPLESDEEQEDNQTDLDNSDLEDDEESYSEVYREKTSSRKQRVPALKKVESLRASNRNGKHS